MPQLGFHSWVEGFVCFRSKGGTTQVQQKMSQEIQFVLSDHKGAVWSEHSQHTYIGKPVDSRVAIWE